MRKIIDDDSVGNIEEPSDKPVKPKRQISDAQREHLNKIRELAMKKKAELKEITLKSKLAKTVPKQDLAKQYDEYVENKVKEKTKKEEVKKEVVSDSEPEVIVKKPKPKPKKKIVYVSESESEEEEVIVKKSKPKTKAQPLEHLVYNNTKDQLYNRMIEERVRNSIIGYGNALGV
jgi:glucan-binding YG repeat protein